MTRAVVGKWVVAVTGLFLCAFLVVHLAGNLPLLWPEAVARPAYNAYAARLAASAPMQAASWVLRAALVAHVAASLFLVVRNRRARGPARYAYARPARTSPWYARSMGALGLVVLVFLGVHVRTFWVTYHLGDPGLDPAGHRDLYAIARAAFDRPWYVAFYVVSIGAVALHLLHGVAAATRSVGLHHPGWARTAARVGRVFAAAVFVGFAALPLWMLWTGGGP